jgi:4-hydroxybenzoate polyprenyltransferase
MGTTRSLNVFLGASPALFAFLLDNDALMRITFVTLSVFLYVLAISMLSRWEINGTQSRWTTIGPFFIVFAVITGIGFAGLLGIFKMEFFVNLILFAGIMIITFKQTAFHNCPSIIQKSVQNMVISIIILDSVFISGSTGLPYGMATLLLIVPSILLSKKLYIT